MSSNETVYWRDGSGGSTEYVAWYRIPDNLYEFMEMVIVDGGQPEAVILKIGKDDDGSTDRLIGFAFSPPAQ